MSLRRAKITPILLLFSAAAWIAAAFTAWLQIDRYVNTGDDIFRWQSSASISPAPWLFHGQDIPFVWGYPPRPSIMALILFAPPALAILLSIAPCSPLAFALRALGRGSPAPASS